MHFKEQKMKSQQNNQSNLYSLCPQSTDVSAQKIQQLTTLARKYYGYEKKFNAEPFFSRQEYYILSLKWLNRWKLYVGYKEVNGAVPPNKLLGCGVLPTANQDIVETMKAGSFRLQDPLFHLNICLKPGLAQGRDYAFISKEMHYCLKDCQDYDMLRIPRQVIKTSQGKKVQLYYLKLTFIVLYNDYCKDIQNSKTQKFIQAKCQFSNYSTVRQMNSQLSRHIKSFVQQKKMVSFATDTMKSWLLNEGLQKNIFFNTLKEGCRANQTFEYKMYINADLLDNEKLLKDYDINQDSLIVAEIKQSQQKNWLFFNSTSIYEGRCNNCKTHTNLTVLCSCKYAAYCSSKCKIQDKSTHKSRCPNQAQSDEEEEVLTLNISSKKGKVGLRNLGNTCFMNSGLQCISHIDQILEYFLKKKYVSQINKLNPLGTKGQLSTCFAKMLQNLWFGTQSSFSPTKLKRAIAKFQPIFQGYNQHDAGQLINYVLDGFHQDLNRVKSKPYVEIKDYDGRPDKLVARQAWQGFLLRNQSIITDLMYGQYKSIVDCPDCQHKSIQFDPFLMLSLPLVNSNLKSIELIFIKDHIEEITLTMTYTPNKKQKMGTLFQDIKKKMNLQKQSRILCYKTSYSDIKLIGEDDQIQEHQKEYYTPKIYVRQLLKGENPKQDFQINLVNTVKSTGYSYYSTKKISNQKLYFFSKDYTYKQVHYKLYSYYKKMYEVSSLENEVINVDPKERPFKFLCKPEYRYKPCVYCGQKDCEGCILKFSDEKFLSGVKTPDQIQMQILWIKNASEIRDIMQKKQAEEMDKDKQDKKKPIKLQECFKLFEQPEILTEDNAWYCPKCKKFVLAKKQMLIYKAPKILILCLKRFKRKEYHSQKLNMFVDYPLQDLDMKKYIINPQLPHNLAESDGPQPSVVYDLIAVCNHMGSTGGGHYTAYCKDIDSPKWSEYDDSSVSSVQDPQKEVVSQAGYVLFYRRRS